MKNSMERIKFISDYIFAYENKIKELNKQGLFDAAKMFELFASEVGRLYLQLSKPLINLNIETSTYPCVDLFSEDGNIYCQVSTCQNVPDKITRTLNKIKNSKNEIIKSIKEVYFIVLNNESISRVNDTTIGKITFNKSKNLITTSNIISKAKENLSFQESLYCLLKKDDDLFKKDFKKFQDSMLYDSRVILDDIDEYINKSYYIDLSSQISEINAKKNKFTLISGEAGSGKSVLCKKILVNKENVLCARAEKLVEAGDVDRIWNFNIKDTLSLVKQEVYIYIDALEFIADNRNKLDVLNSLLERLKELENVYFLCSCRSSDLNSFIRTIAKYNMVEYKTKPVSQKTLNEISKEVPILEKIITNSKYDSLLTNPFYINFLTRLDNFNSIKDENQLRRKIWKEIICLNDDSIEPLITKIVYERATNFSLYSNPANYDNNIIDKLLSYNVLIKNEDGIRLKYDIFEDICFEQYIDYLFDSSKGDYQLFFKNLEGIGRCIYRRYQIWIENKLFSKTNRNKFLYTLVSAESIPGLWEQESIIGIIKSMYCKDFFEEYSLHLLGNNLLIKFINITNIYGFMIDEISFDIGTFVLKNKGYGRESLIKIIYETNFYKSNLKNEKAIKKLIYDYTRMANNEDISTYSFEILKFYIDNALKSGYSYGLIKKEVESIYKLHKVADVLIKEFFVKIRACFFDEDEEKSNFANDAIKDVLSLNCSFLMSDYSNYLMDFYDIYYTTIKKENDPFYHLYHDDFNRNISFGLNDKADDYDHESFNKNPKLFNCIFVLLKKSFWPTFKWYIEFVNKCISTYKEKNEVSIYKIYFSRGVIKDYYGTSEMWMTGEYQNNIPTLLSDMTFIVKSVIIELIQKFKVEDRKTFAENIKKIIYEKSNNIICLSIISNIGLTFLEELPGYCLELVSSLEIVLDDLSRYGLMHKNSTRKMLENEMAIKVGLPDLSMNKYNSINPNNELRKYSFLSQLNYPDLRNKYFEIFDYLYSFIPNDEEHALLYLQLQQMDLRNVSVISVDSNTIEIVPKIDGAAKIISDFVDERNKSNFEVFEKIKSITESLNNESVTIEEIDEFISIVRKNESDPLSFQFNNILISCISFALRELRIDNMKRNEYCKLWIEYAKRQLNGDTVLIDANLYKILFEELNEEIEFNLKNEIKHIILDLLINGNGDDGIKCQIFNVAKRFLLSNIKYGDLYINTLLLLAEDEMNHQIYNYNYLCKYHKKEKISFIPNMQPSLHGVDSFIEHDGRKPFESNKKEIIKKYLFEEHDYNFIDTDFTKLDIKIASHVFSCGLDVNNINHKMFIISYLEQLIDIFNKTNYNSHDIIGYSELSEVEDYFKKRLLDENSYFWVLNIFFNSVDFNKFTRETVSFYLSVLASMTPYYFDSYSQKEQRKHVEKVIHLMEEYINTIQVEWVKYELTKALVLGFGGFQVNGDWSKFNTGYDYNDKMFLNEIFSKYGYLHFYDLLDVINHLQYKYLLPEILISICSSFEKYVKSDYKNENEIDKIKSFINQIVYYAFVNFEKEIKQDSDMIKSFEGILNILINYKDEVSAVLLDEFRIH